MALETAPPPAPAVSEAEGCSASIPYDRCDGFASKEEAVLVAAARGRGVAREGFDSTEAVVTAAQEGEGVENLCPLPGPTTALRECVSVSVNGGGSGSERAFTAAPPRPAVAAVAVAAMKLEVDVPVKVEVLPEEEGRPAPQPPASGDFVVSVLGGVVDGGKGGGREGGENMSAAERTEDCLGAGGGSGGCGVRGCEEIRQGVCDSREAWVGGVDGDGRASVARWMGQKQQQPASVAAADAAAAATIASGASAAAAPAHTARLEDARGGRGQPIPAATASAAAAAVSAHSPSANTPADEAPALTGRLEGGAAVDSVTGSSTDSSSGSSGSGNGGSVDAASEGLRRQMEALLARVEFLESRHAFEGAGWGARRGGGVCVPENEPVSATAHTVLLTPPPRLTRARDHLGSGEVAGTGVSTTPLTGLDVLFRTPKVRSERTAMSGEERRRGEGEGTRRGDKTSFIVVVVRKRKRFMYPSIYFCLCVGLPAS